MFGFRPKLPVVDQDRQWVDAGFTRLEKILGRDRMLRATVILPTPEYFPDPYDKTPDTAEMLFQRVCAYMEVERRGIDFEIFPDETEELQKMLPYWRGNSGGCAGLYTHDGASKERSGERRMLVAVRSTQLND